jgi:hypothetical protein
MALKKSGKKTVKKTVKKNPTKNPRQVKLETKELLEPAGTEDPTRSQVEIEIREILNRIESEIETTNFATDQTEQENRSPKFSWAKPKLVMPRIIIKFSLPVVFVVVLVFFGFLGPQIVGLLGIPTNPTPFTALYFDDPHVSGTGITKGSTLSFGMHNGYPNSKIIKWKVSIADRTFKTGKIDLKPFTSQSIRLRVNKGQPGDFLTISNDALKTSISAVISQ